MEIVVVVVHLLVVFEYILSDKVGSILRQLKPVVDVNFICSIDSAALTRSRPDQRAIGLTTRSSQPKLCPQSSVSLEPVCQRPYVGASSWPFPEVTRMS